MALGIVHKVKAKVTTLTDVSNGFLFSYTGCYNFDLDENATNPRVIIKQGKSVITSVPIFADPSTSTKIKTKIGAAAEVDFPGSTAAELAQFFLDNDFFF